jgi:hypothetical protein
MIISPFAARLAMHFPFVNRVSRPLWRLAMKIFSKPSYWERRRDLKYYEEVIGQARVYAPTGGSVIDVGASEAEVIRRLDWFTRRVVLDVKHILPLAGVENVTADFMAYQPEVIFDLVLCLQVLEHLPNPTPFAKKLLRTGKTVIITVPYKWPEGQCKTHLQDPVDEAKLKSWTRCQPIEASVVEDRRDRLIAVYQDRQNWDE